MRADARGAWGRRPLAHFASVSAQLRGRETREGLEGGDRCSRVPAKPPLRLHPPLSPRGVGAGATCACPQPQTVDPSCPCPVKPPQRPPAGRKPCSTRASSLPKPEPSGRASNASTPSTSSKPRPYNVRKGGHSQAVIEARAASILAKGIIQPQVVKPERRADGSETGYALVTAGEGRRLALRLLAKRKLIPRGVRVRCLVDEANDAVEVSLDENLAREPLPAVDALEAFHDLAERKGWGAETIAARYGVTAAVVRQRLRLAAVAPVLIARHRQGELTLDQLMAFAVSEDHERQRQVFETYPQAHLSAIRRAMTEKTVQADDRRVRCIGVEAYVAAGGAVSRRR